MEWTRFRELRMATWPRSREHSPPGCDSPRSRPVQADKSEQRPFVLCGGQEIECDKPLATQISLVATRVAPRARYGLDQGVGPRGEFLEPSETFDGLCADQFSLRNEVGLELVEMARDSQEPGPAPDSSAAIDQ